MNDNNIKFDLKQKLDEEYKKQQKERKKEQNRIYMKKYYELHKEKLNEAKKIYDKEYHIKNKDKINKRSKEYYENNKEKIKEWTKIWQKEYYAKNGEKIKEYRNKNKDKQRDYCRNYYKENKEKIKQNVKEWREQNPISKWEHDATRRARKINNGGNGISVNDFKELFALQEGKCAHCKIEAKLTLDHIIPLAKGGMHDRSNAQLLCRSCNSSKNDMDPEEFAKRYAINLNKIEDIDY